LTHWLGVGGGLMIALAGVRLVASLRFGVGPTDPWTYAAAGAIIAAIACLACYTLSRRGSRPGVRLALGVRPDFVPAPATDLSPLTAQRA